MSVFHKIYKNALSPTSICLHSLCSVKKRTVDKNILSKSFYYIAQVGTVLSLKIHCLNQSKMQNTSYTDTNMVIMALQTCQQLKSQTFKETRHRLVEFPLHTGRNGSVMMCWCGEEGEEMIESCHWWHFSLCTLCTFFIMHCCTTSFGFPPPYLVKYSRQYRREREKKKYILVYR